MQLLLDKDGREAARSLHIPVLASNPGVTAPVRLLHTGSETLVLGVAHRAEADIVDNMRRHRRNQRVVQIGRKGVLGTVLTGDPGNVPVQIDSARLAFANDGTTGVLLVRVTAQHCASVHADWSGSSPGVPDAPDSTLIVTLVGRRGAHAICDAATTARLMRIPVSHDQLRSWRLMVKSRCGPARHTLGIVEGQPCPDHSVPKAPHALQAAGSGSAAPRGRPR